MKKLMIALAAVALAGAAQAEISAVIRHDAFNRRNLFYDGFNAEKGGSSENKLSGYTIYFINSSGVSGENLLAKLRAGTSFSAAVGDAQVGQATINDGTFTGVPITVEDSMLLSGESLSLYGVVFANGGEDVFLGKVCSAVLVQFGMVVGDTLYIEGYGSETRLDDDATVGYDGSNGGWYSLVSSVPEPTSGLLMLVGMAGLALRRRRR